MTTPTVAAADPGLPAFQQTIFPPTPRRGFLAGLAALSLLGGSIALVGRPRGVAEPATPELIEAYKTWLEYERRALSWQMADDPLWQLRYQGRIDRTDRVALSKQIDNSFAFIGQSHSHPFRAGAPSTRAALVLSTVGCDWREDEDRRAQRRA